LNQREDPESLLSKIKVKSISAKRKLNHTSILRDNRQIHPHFEGNKNKPLKNAQPSGYAQHNGREVVIEQEDEQNIDGNNLSFKEKLVDFLM
jgi:hypothetical protein